MSKFREIARFINKTNNDFLINWIYRFSVVKNYLDAKAKKNKIIAFINEQYPHQITLYDVGAAGGLETSYKPLLKLSKFCAIGFEPDEAEGEALSKSELQLYPFALAGRKGKRKIFITNFSHCSSLYPPNLEVLSEYPAADLFAVRNIQEVDAVSLDDFVKENNVAKPDFLKMDVQGAEYEILQGCSSILEQIVGVYLETHLRELYKGQGLFPAIHSLLSSCGFRLISSKHSKNFAGEILELNVAYVKESQRLLTEEAVIKAICFCVCHENLDFAAHLVRNSCLSEPRKQQFLRLLSRDLAPPETLELLLLKNRAIQTHLFDKEKQTETSQ